MTRNKKGTEKEMRMDGEQGKSPKKPEAYNKYVEDFFRAFNTAIRHSHSFS